MEQEVGFGLHTILPVQFHPARPACPERLLMLAVLEDGLETYRRSARTPGSQRQRRLGAEAGEWIFSDDASWPFSFVSVCHALGIDVAWLRAQLLRPTRGVTAFEAQPPVAAAS